MVGYVQKKAVKKFPTLKLPQGVPQGWIHLLSRGGLTHPNEALVKLCTKLEAQFVQFHGEDIDRRPKPLERLFSTSMSNLNLPLDKKTIYIVKLFLKIRFFNRIKWLNCPSLLKKSEATKKVSTCLLIFFCKINHLL